ncbi:hypothetical protein [Streptomyces enissocaesilis]|uniref:hypothetical protein n=1 Tax=Streptomyces enissocaesilis TaxID=332589 RepID=UPI0031D00F97
MQNMSREELVSLLDDIRDRVAAGDSFEGKLQYLLGTDAEKPFEVAALYRTDNLLGQGSTRTVGVHIAEITCTRCPDTDGPFTAAGLCEPCARPLPLGGVM